MDKKNSKVRVFFLKLLKVLLVPISKIRRFTRKCNIQNWKWKISFGVIVIIICIATVIYLYRLSITVMHKSNKQPKPRHQLGTPIRHIPLDEVYKDFRKNDDKNYVIDDEQAEPAGMINTPGCKIPVAMIDYEKYMKNRSNINRTLCGKRAVFLRKFDNDKVIARIKTQILKRYAKKNKVIHCCHQFIIDSIQYPHDHSKILFSNCTKFQDESIITLESDFINIICSGYDKNNITRVIYDDMYAFIKKIEIPKAKTNTCKIKYNVLMLGMDSMSLPRAVKSLPRTIAFLKADNWLSFRGYHKIADNTFPNLMAALTGKNMSKIIQQCFGKMDDCNKLLIWNAFKEAGYVTAYGEDELKLSDAFTKEYAFREPPTDHYTRPFFLKGETKHHNESLVCTGKVSSGKQLLDYALDFTNTYKKDSFFGLFWIKSFSRNGASHLEDADKILENFLNQLTYTGIMMNTLIMFYSDHGLRFGSLRLKMEGYYDDRMPMNFLWIPLFFKGKQPYELRAVAINQYRLITPYDIYSTLSEINAISQCNNISGVVPEGCPHCHSIFRVVNSNRTCHDAAIHDKWCSCHKLYPLPIQDTIGIKSVQVVVNRIITLVKTIETQDCWRCMPPALKNIIRIHFYYDNDKISIFYVVAFTMTPGNGTYEATVFRKGEQSGYSIIGPISLISSYRGLGKCALNRIDRVFCVCQKKGKC